MKKPTVGMSVISSPMSSNEPTVTGGWPLGAERYFSGRFAGTLYSTIASSTCLTCVATTESTSMGMRLNSSKQPQEPVCASPLRMSAIVW